VVVEQAGAIKGPEAGLLAMLVSAMLASAWIPKTGDSIHASTCCADDMIIDINSTQVLIYIVIGNIVIISTNSSRGILLIGNIIYY
jgi:hypothetical protein